MNPPHPPTEDIAMPFDRNRFQEAFPLELVVLLAGFGVSAVLLAAALVY